MPDTAKNIAGGIFMCLKDLAWNYFNKSGSIEAYLLYKQELLTLGKEADGLVCEHQGSDNKGNEGGGER